MNKNCCPIKYAWHSVKREAGTRFRRWRGFHDNTDVMRAYTISVMWDSKSDMLLPSFCFFRRESHDCFDDMKLCEI